MQDLFHSGGIRAVMSRIADPLHTECVTVNGNSIGANAGTVSNDAVIRRRDQPLYNEGGIAVLYGNLAPDGAVIKQTAASGELLQHRGRAFVFENHEEMLAGVDRD